MLSCFPFDISTTRRVLLLFVLVDPIFISTSAERMNAWCTIMIEKAHCILQNTNKRIDRPFDWTDRVGCHGFNGDTLYA